MNKNLNNKKIKYNNICYMLLIMLLFLLFYIKQLMDELFKL